jgi:serine/threonine protein kinase
MAKALAELQRAGILHCDIKPCNVLLETGAARAKALRPKFGRRAHDTRPAPDAGLGHRLKVIDFGEGNPPEKAAGFVAGTPAYQAPEVAEDGACSFKSDMYSAGVSIVEVWTGQVRPAPPCLLLVKRLPRKAYLQALA